MDGTKDNVSPIQQEKKPEKKFQSHSLYRNLLSFSTEVKYLRVFQDSELLWNRRIKQITDNTTMSIIRRQLLGNTTGTESKNG